MLDYIHDQLQKRFHSDDNANLAESQMNEAIVEYAHLFQELDDLTVDGTEKDSSRPYTKIDIPVEDDIEIDTVELNLLDGRVTDVPGDATVQEAQRELIYNRMKTFDDFYQESFNTLQQYQRETDAQFDQRVQEHARMQYKKYHDHVVQEGLFGFDKIHINSPQVPARITLNLGNIPGKNASYYVKIPVLFQVDKKDRITLKQLQTAQIWEQVESLGVGLRAGAFKFFGEKCGIENEEDIWDAVTLSKMVIPVEPIDQYHVAFGFDMDCYAETQYIEWFAPVKAGKNVSDKNFQKGDSHIAGVKAVSKTQFRAMQEQAVPKYTPSRFFQEAIDFGDENTAPDENGAGGPGVDVSMNDTETPVETTDAAATTDTTSTDTPDDTKEVDTNDVSAEIAEKVSDDTQADADVNLDDVDVNASVGGEDDTQTDVDLDTMVANADAPEDAESTDDASTSMSDLDFDNMTIDELLAQGSEKLKGMTIQQLKDFLNSGEMGGTEVSQEAFFLTRGNIGKELDIHLRKSLGILNDDDMDITELCSAFKKEGKKLNRVVHKASKMKNMFTEDEIKQLLKLNHCLSDLLVMLRPDIDASAVMTVKRLIQAFVSEAKGVVKIIERKKSEKEQPVQEAAIVKGQRNVKHDIMKGLSKDRLSMIKKKGLFGKIFGKKKPEEKPNTTKLPESFPISENELIQIVKLIDDETGKPCVRLSFNKIEKGSAKPIDSVLGGIPPYVSDIPVSIGDSGKQLKFLAQINLSDVPDMEYLPNQGILQFWMHSDLDDEIGGRKADKSIVYIKDTTKPSRVDQLDMSLYKDYNGFPISDATQYKISFKKEMNYLSPYTWDEVDDYFKLFMEMWNKIVSDPEKKITSVKQASDIINMIPERFMDHFDHKDGYNQFGSKIGGYPGFTQSDFRDESYNPKNTFLLLQLDTEEDPGDWIMCWGDCGSAQWFIKKDDLKKLNFKNVDFDWACY